MRFTVGQPVIIHNEFKGVIIECMSWLHYGHHVYKIQLDREFDSINNNTDTPVILDFAKEIQINNWESHPGVTISNNKNGGMNV